MPNIPLQVVTGADSRLPYHLVTCLNNQDYDYDLTGLMDIQFFLKPATWMLDTDDDVVKYSLLNTKITVGSPTTGVLYVQTAAADFIPSRKWYHLDTISSTGLRTVWAYGPVSRVDV